MWFQNPLVVCNLPIKKIEFFVDFFSPCLALVLETKMLKDKGKPFLSSLQGREKDVAIFSCVRASKDKSIGFLADYRRMNVGITRAKSSVLV